MLGLDQLDHVRVHAALARRRRRHPGDSGNFDDSGNFGDSGKPLFRDTRHTRRVTRGAAFKLEPPKDNLRAFVGVSVTVLIHGCIDRARNTRVS